MRVDLDICGCKNTNRRVFIFQYFFSMKGRMDQKALNKIEHKQARRTLCVNRVRYVHAALLQSGKTGRRATTGLSLWRGLLLSTNQASLESWRLGNESYSLWLSLWIITLCQIILAPRMRLILGLLIFNCHNRSCCSQSCCSHRWRRSSCRCRRSHQEYSQLPWPCKPR